MAVFKRTGQRATYAILFAFLLIVILGFGALAVDITFVRLAQMQAQDIADAASQAALFRLRRTGDLTDSRAAAQAVVNLNTVVGGTPTMDDLVFGLWDHTTVPGTFTPTEDRPNAVRVTVGRSGGNAVPYLLGRLFGQTSADVSGVATSATRALHVILVMDITGSWHTWHNNQMDFNNARTAAVAFLDALESAYGDDDMFGMTILTGRYAWEYTPMTYIGDEVASGTERVKWQILNIASKGGYVKPYPTVCTLKPDSPVGAWSQRNDYTTPAGGCYANSPREYTDEPGTDHTTGLSMARTMFQEQVDPTAFRAMVVLTDGVPNGILTGHGAYRVTRGYTETRWREYMGPAPHTTSQIKSQSITMAQAMWDDLGVHTWVVSFVNRDAFMPAMVHGIGYYVNTSDSSALIPIFEDIANSLPMAIVQ